MKTTVSDSEALLNCQKANLATQGALVSKWSWQCFCAPFGESIGTPLSFPWLCFSSHGSVPLWLVYPNQVTSVSPWKYSLHLPFIVPTVPLQTFTILFTPSQIFLPFSTFLFSPKDVYSQPLKTLSKQKPFQLLRHYILPILHSSVDSTQLRGRRADMLGELETNAYTTEPRSQTLNFTFVFFFLV